MSPLPLSARIAIVVLIVIALAEFAPKAINAILVLVLVGMVLNRFQAFKGIFQILNSFGG